jgi:hypothetical protein
LRRAREGELALHLPAICLREGRHAIQQKCQPRIPEQLRGFVHAAKSEGLLSAEQEGAVSQALEFYTASINKELGVLEETLERLRCAPGVDAYALSDEMLERSITLRSDGPDWFRHKAFDEAILAAILVRARQLRESGVEALSFCTLDSDLQPWTKNRGKREPLAGLYEREGIQVYSDFRLA